MIISSPAFGLKIRGISTETKIIKFIGGVTAWNKGCRKWFKLLLQIFFILMKSKNEEVMALKPWFLPILQITLKKHVFWPYLLNLLDFINNKKTLTLHKKKIKNNITLTWNPFQKLLFHTFPNPMNFIFLVSVLMPRIFKSKAGDEIIISDLPCFFSIKLLGLIYL